jgi:hypothetical protein
VDPNGFSAGKAGALLALGDEKFDNPDAAPYYVQTLRVAVGDHVVNVNGHDIQDKPAAEGLPYIAGARWPRTLTFLRQEVIKVVEEKYLGDPVRLFLEWPPICKYKHDACICFPFVFVWSHALHAAWVLSKTTYLLLIKSFAKIHF